MHRSTCAGHCRARDFSRSRSSLPSSRPTRFAASSSRTFSRDEIDAAAITDEMADTREPCFDFEAIVALLLEAARGRRFEPASRRGDTEARHRVELPEHGTIARAQAKAQLHRAET